MRGAGTYLKLQLKRALRLLPWMLGVTLLLLALAALTALLLRATRGSEDDARVPVQVGIVGDLEDDHLGDALKLLEKMDFTRFSLHMQPMAEEEARAALLRGEIDGYARIPEGFVSALARGEHRPVVYVTAQSGADLAAQLTRQLAEALSELVLETENAVYGAQDYAADHLPDKDADELGTKLALRFMLRALDREKLFALELVEGEASLSFAAYYLCGVFVLFLMLWAIAATPLCAGRDRELPALLRARGLSLAAQTAADFLSYALLMLLALLLTGLLALPLLAHWSIRIPELADACAPRLLGGAVSVALMLCAVSFLLFELSSGTVGAVLLQFFNALLQGLLAGCFYPASFYPAALRRLGEALPAGLAMTRLRALLLGQPDARAAGAVWAVTLLAGLAVWLLRCGRRERL